MLCMIVTLVIGAIATMVTQSIRMAGDDPQVQMARDAARMIGEGSPPLDVIPQGSIDPSVSPASFVVVYDSKGQALASSLQIGGLVPSPSVNVFDQAWNQGEYRLVWQPTEDARVAVVIVPVLGQPVFVLAGRSTGETEDRVATIRWTAFLSWCVTVVMVTCVMGIIAIASRRDGDGGRSISDVV